MAFYTPRGVKIRIDPTDAFTMLARLYPKCNPVNVVTTAESLEALTPTLLQFTVLSLLFLDLPLPARVVIVSVVIIVGEIMLRLGLWLPGLTSLSRFWLSVPWWIVLAAFISVGFFRSGWLGVALVAGLWVWGTLLELVIDHIQAKRNYGRHGVLLFGSEIAFIQACRLHALSIGVPFDPANEEAVSPGQVEDTANAYFAALQTGDGGGRLSYGSEPGNQEKEIDVAEYFSSPECDMRRRRKVRLRRQKQRDPV